MPYIAQHLSEAIAICQAIDPEQIEKMVVILHEVRATRGRLFILGVGGSAANASHAVNDFRKICDIEAYAPTDNVSELTARTNDEGWESTFAGWLKVSRLSQHDALLILSVGGGNREKNVSTNLVRAVDHAHSVGAKILGILGRDGGYAATLADACCLVPVVNATNVTPHSEAFQAVVWHAIVSHPLLKVAETKWESVVKS